MDNLTVPFVVRRMAGAIGAEIAENGTQRPRSHIYAKRQARVLEFVQLELARPSSSPMSGNFPPSNWAARTWYPFATRLSSSLTPGLAVSRALLMQMRASSTKSSYLCHDALPTRELSL